MRISLRELRDIIENALEENGVDTEMRNMAGMCAGGLGVSSGRRDKEASLMNPPPGLGSPESQEEDEPDGEEVQKKSQFAVRVTDRQSRRPSRT